MNRKALLSFLMILGLVIFVSKTLPAAGRPDVTRHEATFMESAVNMHIEWQSPNPVVMVKITIANKEQNINVDPYNNRRNRDGYAGEVNVTVGLDWVPSQPFNYVIQLEDELRIKSPLARGKVKIASAPPTATVTQPQQPTIQFQIQQNIPPVGIPQTPGGAQPPPAPGQGGSLVIIITPQIVVDAGAAWRVGGGQWMKSGETFPNLTPGIYQVDFQEVYQWIKPESQMVMIEDGKIITLNGLYNKK